MANRDLHNNIKVIQTVSPVAVTGNPPSDLNGEVDGRGYEGVEHIVTLGVSGTLLSSSVKVELKIEDSPDNAIWTSVTDNNHVLGQTVGAGGPRQIRSDFRHRLLAFCAWATSFCRCPCSDWAPDWPPSCCPMAIPLDVRGVYGFVRS